MSWSDDDVTTFPGERLTLTATVPTVALAGTPPAVAVSGFDLR